MAGGWALKLVKGDKVLDPTRTQEIVEFLSPPEREWMALWVIQELAEVVCERRTDLDDRVTTAERTALEAAAELEKATEGSPRCGCGATEDLEWGPDPFNYEMNHDDTPLWQCSTCNESSGRDV